jgi:hypothetical protein
MRKLSLLAAATFAATAIPASATILIQPASFNQGTLVHGTGTEQIGTTVTGNLGQNGPNIVNFNGDTTETVATSDNLRLQQGSGQADVTGAEITLGGNPNDTYDILSGNIYLTGYAGMSWIEFGLTSGVTGTLDFYITDNFGNVTPFLDQIIGKGDTFFAFEAINGESITNVFYSADTPPGGLTILKQVRIDLTNPNDVPEPSTWAMMLLGLGATGIAIRRSRKKARVSQLA